MTQPSLTDDQQELYAEVVERAAAEARGDQARVLAAYARAGYDPLDIEAVRSALLGSWRPTSSDAVMSLVVGLLGLFVCPLPFIGGAAIIYGRRAQRETQTGIKSGDGMATAGLVLGWINVGLWTPLLLVWLGLLLMS